MSKDVVKIGDLGESLSDLIKEYSTEVQIQSAQAVEKYAQALAKEIPSTNAFKDGTRSRQRLKNSFVVTATVNEVDNKVYAIHAKKPKYRLVHLIENGHQMVKKGGTVVGEVPAHHFLLPLAEKYKRLLDEEIREIIENTK